MRTIINVILGIICLFLVWVLYRSIEEPIKFEKEKNRRELAVIGKLQQIRTAQELYRGITGNFAPTFDTLREVLENGRFKIIQVFGDPDDPSNTEALRYDTIYKSAIDSVQALGIDLATLDKVPFNDTAHFEIFADTITYQNTLVPVVEVGVPRKVFMGPYADPAFAKYDKNYDPESYLKFGDRYAPNLTGNWE